MIQARNAKPVANGTLVIDCLPQQLKANMLYYIEESVFCVHKEVFNL